MQSVDLKAESDAIHREIEEAFSGVSREGAISWRQASENSIAHDEWMEVNATKPEDLFKGRDITWRQLTHEIAGDEESGESGDPEELFHDQDKCWQDLVEDWQWKMSPEHGGFSYLDPVGFRYYLPAAIIMSLADPECFEISTTLTIPNDSIGDFDWHVYKLEKWSGLNERQRSCVKRFVAYKMAVADAKRGARFKDIQPDLIDLNVMEIMKSHEPWRRAYQSYWVGI